MASMEPTNAAITMPKELIIMPFSSRKIMVSATTSFAPDEIPSTYGPAIGFWKKLWSKNPDTDSAPPNKIAARMRGSLIFHTICENVSSFPLPARIANRSDVDMSTLPAPTFHNNNTDNMIIATTKEMI